MIRGFVTPERTTLIASTHRVYAISEKSARGNGIASSEAVLTAARRRTQSFMAFDMAAAAEQAHSAISAVMFGALAGSGALPFAQAAYTEAMRAGGKGSQSRGVQCGTRGSAKCQQWGAGLNHHGRWANSRASIIVRSGYVDNRAHGDSRVYAARRTVRTDF
jgi:hypothetical protein